MIVVKKGLKEDTLDIEALEVQIVKLWLSHRKPGVVTFSQVNWLHFHIIKPSKSTDHPLDEIVWV